jgi:hypothetical protein
VTECTTWQDELFEAAPDELAGVAPTALAGHVRECHRCGETARLLLAEHARLGTALSLVQPRVSADAAAGEILSMSDVVVPYRPSRGERLQRVAATIFPMAAAAALAIYVVYGRDDVVPTPVVEREQPATAVRITAPPGTGTIVLKTSDPDITFAWIGQEIDP